MTVLIEFQGRLDPIELAGDFKDVLQDLRLAAAGGAGFAIAQKPDGKQVGLAIYNILTVTEAEEDNAFFGG